MKKLLALLLVAAFFATLFVGCKDETAPAETEPQIEYLRLVQGGATEFKIVSYLKNSKPADNLAKALRTQTGVAFTVVDSKNAGAKNIYIGTAEKLAGLGGVSATLYYTTYEIKVDSNNIYVAISDKAYADKVVEKLATAIVKVEDGVFGIDMSTAGVKNVSNISCAIPVFTTASGSLREIYEAGSDNYQVSYNGLNARTSDAEVAAYRTSLEAAGYVLHQMNEVNGSQFFTYTQGDTMIHCNYFKSMREFRIIYGPLNYLGSATPITEYERKVTPSISIVGSTDSVLCMVYQAPDGSFVIIDGGYSNSKTYNWTLNEGKPSEHTFMIERNVETDMANLWAVLASMTPEGQKPQVTWMITHGDPDHIGLPPVFINRYKDQFDLNLVCYNFPIIKNIGLKNGESPATYQTYIDTFIKSVNNHFPNAQHMVYHTGQKLYLPGTEIEFLFTAEDYWPNAMTWMNHTSGAWRITSEGKTIMITGDCETGLNEQMVRVFGDYLKSDILQLNHHGSNGATLNFYKKVQPTVAFWACTDTHFEYDMKRLGTATGFEFNEYIRNTALYHYSGSYTHTILLPTLEEKK